MNYLAHLLLAEDSDDARLGALLGDFVSGADLSSWPAVMQLEIRLHRRVDTYTDAHPQVQALRSLFPQGGRRFAGIALDLYFDHLLARDWARFHSCPLQDFSAQVYAMLNAAHARLPAALQAVAPRMAAQDWLGGYRQRASVDRALRGIAHRLTRGEGLISCLPLLDRHAAEIERAFHLFMPELLRFAPRERMRLQEPARDAAAEAEPGTRAPKQD